jgi:ribulose-phosphate 3-epimerase
MSRIIPAILVHTEPEFRRQVSLAALFRPPVVQADVLDNTLYPKKSFSFPDQLAAMHLSIPFEAHLMIDYPEKKVASWIKAGAERVIIHCEAKGNLGLAIETIRHNGRLAGMAIDPRTDLAQTAEFAPFVDYFLVMGVIPGSQGQKFLPETVERVRSLKRAFPRVKIGVDGGVTDFRHIVRELASAGADDLTVGSAIWQAPDPAKAYADLVKDATIQ